MRPLNSFLDWCRNLVRRVMHRIALLLNSITGGHLSPNTITITGLLAHIPIAWLIATRHNYWAAGLLVIFGLFDTLDGEMARLQGRSSTTGMLLDSITDRAKEILLYSGIAYAIIASTGRPYLAVWAVAACGCSLLISYVNAWGEVVFAKKHINHDVNKTFRGGLLAFEIRMFLVVIGLLTDRLALLVIVITIGAIYTSLIRLSRIIENLNQADVQS